MASAEREKSFCPLCVFWEVVLCPVPLVMCPVWKGKWVAVYAQCVSWLPWVCGCVGVYGVCICGCEFHACEYVNMWVGVWMPGCVVSVCFPLKAAPKDSSEDLILNRKCIYPSSSPCCFFFSGVPDSLFSSEHFYSPTFPLYVGRMLPFLRVQFSLTQVHFQPMLRASHITGTL